jgi:hypothetical protein
MAKEFRLKPHALREGLYQMRPLMLPCYVHSDGRVEFPNAKTLDCRLGTNSATNSDNKIRIDPSSLVKIIDPNKYIKTKEIELKSLIRFIKSKI